MACRGGRLPLTRATSMQRDLRNQHLNKRLFTLKEAAVYLGRTEWGMRDLIWSGQVPVVRNQRGRKIFIDVLDMDAFINKQKDRYT